MNTLRGLRQVFTPRRIHFGSCAARFARVLGAIAPRPRLHDVNTCSYLLVLVFGGYRSSALLPPLGSVFSTNCVFSAFKKFFSRHILSKKFNWESAAVRKCGPTRLIFAQVLVHIQLIWHWSWSPPCPCSWPSSWHSCVFSCFIPSQGWSNYFTFT